MGGGFALSMIYHWDITINREGRFKIFSVQNRKIILLLLFLSLEARIRSIMKPLYTQFRHNDK